MNILNLLCPACGVQGQFEKDEDDKLICACGYQIE